MEEALELSDSCILELNDVVLQASTFDYTEGSHTGTRKWKKTDKKISCKQSINFKNIRKKNEKNQKELGKGHEQK